MNILGVVGRDVMHVFPFRKDIRNACLVAQEGHQQDKQQEVGLVDFMHDVLDAQNNQEARLENYEENMLLLNTQLVIVLLKYVLL